MTGALPPLKIGMGIKDENIGSYIWFKFQFQLKYFYTNATLNYSSRFKAWYMIQQRNV